jgi:small conductance mechanosensitive channel
LALAFAFQDMAANFLSGVMISLRKPFVPGDIVETHDFFGTIELVDMRNTTLRTPDGQRVLIPNRHVFENPIRNYTAFNRRRIDLEVGVSYGDDLEAVERVTLEAVGGVSARDPNKEIDFFFTGFGDSSINLVVRFWIDYHKQRDYLGARSEAIMKIKKAYDEADITIPFPIRTLDFGIKGGADLGEVAPRLKAAGE